MTAPMPARTTAGAPVLSVQDLVVSAKTPQGPRTIVDGVSFDLHQGEILGLVGESGSGKTVTCRALMRLLPATSLGIRSGSIRLMGQDITHLPEDKMCRLRGSKIGMIFQNPTSHLDPVMRIGEQIAESIRFHEGASRREAKAKAVDLLRQVGIPDPQNRVDNFPHEFSGGMRQRALIATALACNPGILVADEPTTALDVTVQAQILRLLLDLRDQRGLAMILITHDLGVVAQTCDSIAVMYGGRLAETGPKRVLLRAPRHPYTARLIACQPGASAGSGPMPSIPGQPPSVNALPSGCRFHPRCDLAVAACRQEQPPMREMSPRHLAACHRAEEVVPLRADAGANQDRKAL
jgi:peptide/nickel transport system ATP-binding protein